LGNRTAALPPGERPSWCSAAQHPVSAPNAFALPDATTVFLPDGNGRTIEKMEMGCQADKGLGIGVTFSGTRYLLFGFHEEVLLLLQQHNRTVGVMLRACALREP
jgi:hypothetical protein